MNTFVLVIRLGLVLLLALVQKSECKEINRMLDEELMDYNAVKNETLDSRFYFWKPNNSNNDNNDCVSTFRCCRIRCPAVNGAAATSHCSSLAPLTRATACDDDAGTGPMPGLPCLFSPNCQACYTDNKIACAGLTECTLMLGSDICPYLA